MVSGEGPMLTVCFHGFGEDADSFKVLGAGLKGHRLVALDLPFHGATEWNEELSLSVQELMGFISACPEVGEKPFGLMGYSMGGKVALALFQAFPQRIRHLILLAPDGLRPAPWHWFGTKTLIGNRLLRFTMEKPGWFVSLLDAGKKTGLVNESIFKFVHLYIDDSNLRQKVYRIWTTLRNFRPDTDVIKNHIRLKKVPVFMLFGKFDRLCPYQDGISFAKGLGKSCRMDIIDTGHMLLHPRFISKQMEGFEFCTRDMENRE
jgi:pimeloyl-ACP methyl ester carboxylesterase